MFFSFFKLQENYTLILELKRKNEMIQYRSLFTKHLEWV